MKNFIMDVKKISLGLIVLVFLTLIIGDSASASSASVTDINGGQLQGVLNIVEENPQAVNGLITSPVIGQPYTRKVTVSIRGNAYSLPRQIGYYKFEAGFAIPFSGRLSLQGIYGCGYNTYGVYSASPASYIRLR